MFASLILQEARERAGISQTELGARVGVKPTVISRWERGEVALNLDRLSELVAGCGLELDIALRPADNSQVTLIDAARALAPERRLFALRRRVQTVAQLQGRDESFDPQAMLRTLTDAGVVFVVIGGVAAALQGDPHPTYGLDIVPRPGARNAARLVRALDAMQAGGEHHDGPVRRYETSLGVLQLIAQPAGTRGYRDLARAAEAMDLGDMNVHVASLADLIRSKDAIARADERGALTAMRQLALRTAA